MANRKKTTVNYSCEEIAKAMKAFKQKGGLIRKLPDEMKLVSNRVSPSNLADSSPYEDIIAY